MQYPVWELELGGGLLIAVVAILHVYVSHFAIGGGLFLVLTEHYAYHKNDPHLREYLITHSRFFALVTLVFGALTGVGIWFTIGLISPAATTFLIRNFVWAWATEWVLFFVEIAAAILYYRTWDRLPRSTHLVVGWVYFVSAFLSLVVINGIITFMLTPGEWLKDHDFWNGFFNPTYWPSLAARTAICTALAGVYALITSPFVKDTFTKARLIRYAGLWALVGVMLAVPSMWWYHKLLPAGSAELFAGAMPTTVRATEVLMKGTGAFLALLLLPVVFPGKFRLGLALVTATVALLLFGASEWIRESVRKPYVIYGYMYGNGLRLDEVKSLSENGGFLANSFWVENHEAAPSASVGKDIFRIACRSCHTLDGYRGLRKSLMGLDEKFLYELIGRLQHLRGRMPPFAGTEVERRALAKFLAGHVGAGRPAMDGKSVFERRCGVCHTQQAFRPLYDSLKDYSSEDFMEALTMLGDLSEEMAPWSGSEEEADILTEYILSWYEGKTPEKEHK